MAELFQIVLGWIIQSRILLWLRERHSLPQRQTLGRLGVFSVRLEWIILPVKRSTQPSISDSFSTSPAQFARLSRISRLARISMSAYGIIVNRWIMLKCPVLLYLEGRFYITPGTLSTAVGNAPFPKPMAKAPTVTAYNAAGTAGGANMVGGAAVTVNSVASMSTRITSATLSANQTAGWGCQFHYTADTGW